MKHVFDMYVQTIDEHGSAIVGSVTRFADMLVDARKIWDSEKKPVFLRIINGDEEQLFPLIGGEGQSMLDQTNQEVVYSFCYKLATADDDRLDSASPETIMQDAVKMHEESGKTIELEIELMRNNELFYHGDRTITERITLISAEEGKTARDLAEKWREE